MKAGVPKVSRTVLTNYIRHVDTHNRIQEENDCWRQRLSQTHQDEATLRNGPTKRVTKVPGVRHTLGTNSSLHGAHMDNAAETVAVSYLGRGDADRRGDGERSTYWMKELYKAEQQDPDRWGHSGYHDLYPDDFTEDKVSDKTHCKPSLHSKSSKLSNMIRSRERRSEPSDESDNSDEEHQRKKKKRHSSQTSEEVPTHVKRKKKHHSLQNSDEVPAHVKRRKKYHSAQSSDEVSARLKRKKKSDSSQSSNEDEEDDKHCNNNSLDSKNTGIVKKHKSKQSEMVDKHKKHRKHSKKHKTKSKKYKAKHKHHKSSRCSD